MRRYLIKTELDSMSHPELKTFADNVLLMMTANPNYPLTNPTLIQLGMWIIDFGQALSAWGTFPSNRGSSVQYAAVLTTRDVLEVGLISLAASCTSTTPFDKDAFLSAGWQVKRLSSPVGLVG